MPLVRPPQTPKILAAPIGSKHLCHLFAMDICLLNGRRALAARSCPHSPATPSRHTQIFRDPILHALGIPLQDWAPEARDAPALVSLLVDTDPGSSLCVYAPPAAP